jgi:predicted nucleic acid-binding protein
MSRILFIDSGPLGYALTPTVNEEHLRCSQWLEGLLMSGEQVAIAEIVDYECRRGWLRTDNHAALAKLDDAKAAFTYVPITTAAMILAAQFWAAARKGGYASTTEQRLDADVILAAQASTYGGGEKEVVVATTNVRHLAHFVAAYRWEDVQPRT